MAKPGRDARAEMRRLAAGAVDLGAQVEVPATLADKVRKEAEGQLGLRCSGCGERIGVGLKFTRIDVLRGPDGHPVVDVAKLAACNGAGGCDFAEKARNGAHLVEMVEYVWLQGDAPVGAADVEAAVQEAQDAARPAEPVEAAEG